MKKNEKLPFLVCIGASAGGLSACRNFLRQLKLGDAIFVYCQHLSPTHDSMLVDILSRENPIPVKQVEHNAPLQTGNFYVAPPNRDISIVDNKFVLSSPKVGTFSKPSIDNFFHSAAEQYGHRVIAVILSGSGSDGAVGITKVRGQAGIVLAQDPDLSEFSGMPNAAVNTQAVDSIGDPETLASIVNHILENGVAKPSANSKSEADLYSEILELIRIKTGNNFSSYRKSTIERRILRRMSIRGIKTYKDYKCLLENEELEIKEFVRDAFIVVSEFYRDIDDFNALKKSLLSAFEAFDLSKTFRVWVPGCATGEEAYTIAMILCDIQKELGKAIEYKIMATDISNEAIAQARQARFERDKILNCPTQWFDDYFEENEDYLIVKTSIRERVIFSVHNVFYDPPFSNIDLVTCRNLMIYFDEDLQSKVLHLFHYSININGLLMLGPSESVRGNALFKQLADDSKLFHRTPGSGKAIHMQPLGRKILESKIISKKREAEDSKEKHIFEAIAKIYSPPLIVVDQNNKLMYSSGNFHPLISTSGVFFKEDIFDLLNPQYRASLRAMSFKVRRTNQVANSSNFNLEIKGEDQQISLSIHSMGDTLKGWLAISYTEVRQQVKLAPNKAKVELNNAHIMEIEHELSATRENLQTVIEELETTNEQLQIYNEELQSTNEEYQSTNEELQTVNEELQSTNEELITINEEYSIKANEQTRLSSDLFNLQESLEIPVLLINREYRIQRFTEKCSVILDTSNIKVGDLFFALNWYNEIPDLHPVISEVEKQQAPVRQIVLISGKYYDCQIAPYKDTQETLDGFTVIFYDTTELKLSKDELGKQQKIAETTLNTIAEGVIRINTDCEIEYVNPAALEILERDVDDLIDKKLHRRLFVFKQDGEEVDLKSRIENLGDSSTPYHFNAQLKTQFGNDYFIEIILSRLRDGEGYVLALRDITEKQNKIDQLEWQSQHDSLTGLVNRNEMEKRIDRAITTSKRDNIESSLLYLDLDQFKVVNDTCGHLAGDKLLQQLAHIMLDSLRSRDTLARLGGDEFAILLDHCPLLDSESIARKIQKQISTYRFVWDEKVFRVGASIGIVSINKSVDQVSEVLSDADTACYAAKEQGRNAIELYSPDNELLEKHRMQMHRVSDINEAFDKDLFRLYFQEVRDINTDAAATWEVLLRMFNTNGEFLTPSSFLPAAERFGLISRVDYWVIENAIGSVRQYITRDSKVELPILNINLSANTITNSDCIKILKSILEKYAYPAEKITFEITETATISNMSKATEFIAALRLLGCRFALDDFGTGMSSLSYLRNIDLDYLKIDASFIQDVASDKVNSAIVKSVTDVAHQIDLKVVAEGVETKQQLAHLKHLGIDLVQGFYMHKPCPFEEFIAKQMA